MRTSTNVYLLVLSLADSVYLLMNIVLSQLSCNKPGLPLAVYSFDPYGRALSNFSGNVAVWVTVVFTVERYLAVCHPIHGKVWCTVSRARLASLAVVILVFLNTAPTLFEREVIIEYPESSEDGQFDGIHKQNSTSTFGNLFGGNVANTTGFPGFGNAAELGDVIGAAHAALSASPQSDISPAHRDDREEGGALSSLYDVLNSATPLGPDLTSNTLGPTDYASRAADAVNTAVSDASQTDALGASISEMFLTVATTAAATTLVAFNGGGTASTLSGQNTVNTDTNSGIKEATTESAATSRGGVPRCVETSLATTPSYMIGYTWWYVIVFSFIPLILLAIFNTVLIRALILAGRIRQQMAVISTSTKTTTTSASSNKGASYVGLKYTDDNRSYKKKNNKENTEEGERLTKQQRQSLRPCTGRNLSHTGNNVMADCVSSNQNSNGFTNDAPSNASMNVSVSVTRKHQSRRISREQNKVTLLLVTIVMIFFFCQLPWTALYLYTTFDTEISPSGRTRIKIAGNVCNLLALLNASVNFYLYSFFSKRFRRTLAKLFFFFWRRERNNSPTTV